MKRPYISISGTLDELILMEAILAYYYTIEDNLSNDACDERDLFNFKTNGSWIICHPYGDIMYANNQGYFSNKENSFKASQIHEILTYIEEYEKV